ncbi:MAG: UDP-N-acetylmuramate--L-alanine ligase, partial [Desulfovibrio desulfuricans]|nr:UDP-N-acetylmuramate--L-alanine ligase [Desulfovibrio desulfuricans]
MNSKIRRIHMVGIGGAGMSGIAEVLLNQGYEVSGSDMSDSAVVRHLRDLGALVAVGHAAENVGDVQVLVKSTAISDENPELVEARRRNIAIIPRAEMLAELMRLRQGIAIAGTHGKTTTTSLTASIFDTAELDPTVIIGGRLNAYGTNAHLGHGEYLIAEADESDGSFLCLLPIINVVTNVDEDHLDHYKTRQGIDDAFVQFMNNVPFYGLNIVCGDDPGVRALLARVKRPVLTYGFAEDNVLRAVPLECGVRNNFEVWRNGVRLGQVSLPQPGRHNMLNALAAIGAAMEVDISFDKCADGLNGFGGVGRRFEFKGEKGGVTVVDDYGHHPAEIAATLATARQVFPGRRIVAAFQPHRFSRTQAHFGEFCKVFDNVDQLLLTEIYAASE